MQTFSIIIPVYNVKDYLDACVQSILDQTYSNYEIILVDDGSTDESGHICDLWSQRDSRIVTIHKENGGASSARNRGLDAVSGDYVLFLDSDDYWLSADVLEKLASRIDRTKPDVLIFNYQKEYGEKLEKPYFDVNLTMPSHMNEKDGAEYVFRNLLWTACAWNKATDAKLFVRHGLRFEEGTIGEDIDWSLRLALVAERFDFLNVPVLAYRQRAGSVTGSYRFSKVIQLYENICRCLTILEQAPKERGEALRPFVAYQFATLVHNVAIAPASPEKKALAKNVKNLQYILEWSEDSKVRLIRNVWKAGGFCTVLWLLKLREKLDVFRRRRSD